MCSALIYTHVLTYSISLFNRVVSVVKTLLRILYDINVLNDAEVTMKNKFYWRNNITNITYCRMINISIINLRDIQVKMQTLQITQCR